jgi:hypothetical protein
VPPGIGRGRDRARAGRTCFDLGIAVIIVLVGIIAVHVLKCFSWLGVFSDGLSEFDRLRGGSDGRGRREGDARVD